MFKRIIAICVAAVCCAALLGGCSSGSKNPGLNDGAKDKTAGYQLEAPAAGEEIAILHTNMGDITLRFFPEVAPKAVTNFKTLAQEGYYDGVTFHRVINNFMIQGGDPTGSGSGGKSIYDTEETEGFEDEFSTKLLNLRGSLSMANAKVDSNSCQFFINQAPSSKFGSIENRKQEQKFSRKQYKEFQEILASSFPDYASYAINSGIPPLDVPDEVWELYKANGGNITLDGAWRPTGGHTVFGQVIEGMDIVDAIAAVPVNSNSKPDEDVTIDSIEFKSY